MPASIEPCASADLPEGVQILQPSSGEVEVLVQITQRGVRQSLPSQQVTIVGVGTGSDRIGYPDEITIEVVAPDDALAELDASTLQVIVDASGTGGWNLCRATVGHHATSRAMGDNVSGRGDADHSRNRRPSPPPKRRPLLLERQKALPEERFRRRSIERYEVSYIPSVVSPAGAVEISIS